MMQRSPVRWRVSARLLAALLLLAMLSGIASVAVLRHGTGAAAERTDAQAALPTITLEIDGHRLVAEVARTGEQRYMGLSFRPRLADDAGMLFVYPDARPRAFTMRNTLIPLSIAFIDETRTINEIIDMNVGPGQIFPSTAPAMYALEVNQGWFEQRDIEPGARIRLVEAAERSRLSGADR